MRIISILLSAIISVAAFGSTGKLDLASRQVLSSVHRSQHRARSVRPVDAVEPQLYLPAILKLKEGETVDDLVEMGAKIMRQRQQLVLAFIPTDQIDLLATNSGVQSMSVGQRRLKTMDKARDMAGATPIVDATEDYPATWGGRGVVVGLTDIGYDPHHPNFIAPDGTLRTKRIVNYCDTSASVTRLYTPAEIDAWVTDDDDEWHGTHVAGTLAGSCRATPYYGIAQHAEIVAATSLLTDACILDGVEEIIDYAKSQGKPAVVNMSIGSYIGPHDGTSLFNQYLDLLGHEAIVCMSSGNEAAFNSCVQVEFTPEVNSSSIFVTDRHHYDAVQEYGAVDFWSADGRPFEVAFSIFDHKEKKVVKTFEFKGGQEGEWEIASPGMGGDDAESDEVFNQCFKGYLKIMSGIDPENGRYRVYVPMNVTSTDKVDWVGRYFVTLSVKGEPGTKVYGYADGYNVYFVNWGRSGFLEPNTLQSISDIACGHNVLVVGASTSRDTTPRVSGEDKFWDWHTFTVGEIAYFSSYGTLIDGRTLPHICAPGLYVVSSVSTPFVEKYPEVIPELAAEAEVDGKKAWWVAECGTSMSSPLTAGVIATWLEVNPTLTIEQVREIAMKTASHDAPDAANPQWGGGALDAMAGMREVLILSGAESLPSYAAPEVGMTYGNGLLRITYPSHPTFDVTVCRVDGTVTGRFRGHDYALDVATSGWTPGVYIVAVEGSAPRKIVVR